MSLFIIIALVLAGVCLVQIASALELQHAQLAVPTLADEDLGGTWTKSTYGEGWGWFDIAISSNGQKQIAVVNVGTLSSLYQSSDYGETWFLSTAPEFDSSTDPNKSFWAVASSGDGQYLAAAMASTGSIYLSSDYGATWAVPTGPPIDKWWYDITMTPDGKYIGAVINKGYMWYSWDFGVTWDKGLFYNGEHSHGNIEEDFFSIDVSDSGQYWVASCSAGGYSTGNVYYGQWEKYGIENSVTFDRAVMNGLPVGSTLQWVGVSISSDGSKVTAVNSMVTGGVFQSADYGATFYLTTTAPAVMSLGDSAMSSDGSVQIVTTSKYIYLSADGGASWNVSSPEGGTWLGVAIDDGGDFMAAANSGVGVYSYLPNCPYGEIHTGFGADGVNGCVPCGAGTYEEYFGAPTCTDCADGTYSTTDANYLESTCKDCVYPWTTISSGASSCFVFWLEVSLGFYLPLCGVLLAVLAGIFVFGNDNQVVVLIIMGLPALDVLTDLVYLLISRFYSLAIFVLCLVCFLHPAPMFFYKLYKYSAWPYSIRFIWWLGSSSTYSVSAALHGADTPEANQGDHIPFPTILGRRFSVLITFHHHDNLYVMILELLTWVVAIALQGLTLILLPLFLVFWLCAGVFLQMTKTIAMGSVWNFWFYVWTGYTHWSDVPGSVDTEDLNYGLLTQFCLETIPHVILQSVNNTLLGTWVSDPIAIFSLVMSIFMSVATIYKYVYHVGIRADRQEMRNIPIDKSVTIKMMCSDFEYTILNAKLPPHSRNIMVPTAEQLKFQDHKYAVAGTEASDTDVVSPLTSPAPPVVLDGSTNSLQSNNNSNALMRSVHAGDEEQQGHPQMAYAEAVYSDNDFSGGESTPSAPYAVSPPPQTSFRPLITVPYIPPPSPVPASASSGGLMSLALPSPSARNGTPSPVATPSRLGGSLAPSDYPPELICPLTRRVMTDPVICADGYTYERAAIEQHIRSQKELQAQLGQARSATSPLTKEPLDSEQLFPNRALAALLAKYQGV